MKIKKGWMLFVLAVLIGDLGNHFSSLWILRWLVLVCGLLLFLSWGRPAKKKSTIPFSIQLFVSYAFVQGVFSAYFRYYHPTQDPSILLLLQSSSMDSILVLFAFIIFLGAQTDLSNELWVAGVVQWVGIVLSPSPRYSEFFISNPSMAATFVVLTIAPDSYYTLAFALSAVLITHSWVALGVFIVFALRSFPRFWRSLPGLATLWVSFLACLGYCFHNGGIPDNHRWDQWRDYVQFWNRLPTYSHIFGTGIGTGRVYSPMATAAAAHTDADGWIRMVSAPWLHSDWLQAFCELGYVGFGLTLLAALVLYWNSRGKNRTRLLAFYVAMIANFPTHWAMTALIGWDIVSRTLSRKDDWN